MLVRMNVPGELADSLLSQGVAVRHPPIRGSLIEVLSDVGSIAAVTITLLQGPNTLRLAAVAFRDFFLKGHAKSVSLSMKGPNGTVRIENISESDNLDQIAAKLRDILE